MSKRTSLIKGRQFLAADPCLVLQIVRRQASNSLRSRHAASGLDGRRIRPIAQAGRMTQAGRFSMPILGCDHVRHNCR